MVEPICDDRGLRSRIGEVVDVCGQYEVWNMGPHRVMVDLPDGHVQSVREVVNLLLEDGTVVRLWVRPDKEMETFRGQMVVVRGTLYAEQPSAIPASVPTESLSLLKIERIEMF